jgi:hypothetical protein
MSEHHETIEEQLARMTTARDCLSEELKRIEAAVDATGGTKFEATPQFIERLAKERNQAWAAIRLLPADARFQAACAALQGMLASGHVDAIEASTRAVGGTAAQGLAAAAVGFADALFAALETKAGVTP